MNRMLEVWKEIPPAADSNSNAIPPTTKSQSDPSNLGSASDGRSLNASQSLKSVQSSSPLVTRKSRFSSSRSPPPDASPIVTARKINGSIRSKILSPPLSRKMDHTKTSEWRVEIAVGNTPVKAVTEEKLFKDHEQGGKDGNVRSRLEARRMLFSEEKGSKSAVLRSGARVVPFQENGSLELTAGTDNMSDEAHEGHRDGDLSLIRRQLVQIENQQSSLLDLLQKFIGSSQNGMHSLETRVHGMEMALDEISRDLAASSGRMSNNDTEVNNTCCRLPGTEFLSSRFWRRHDGRYSSRFSVSDIQYLSEENRASYKWDKQRVGFQGGIVVNPLAEINPQSKGRVEVSSRTTVKGGGHGAGN
ncbi:TORTIFOLIA1-like protein 3 [Ananas comosus]|uniref:TORTIFOLIA1-like protein 3 n=1 Tax=Ananas comosus TaxID=4615 RepID=A0A6P5F229_ANACO|nr:TORTIFOLIA1-like protein 3 [Ananas comosus]